MKSKYWNCRVVKRKCNSLGFEEMVFAIHEVYYDKNDKPISITSRPSNPQGDTLEELRESFKLYERAFKDPVLSYEDFRGGI